MSDVVDTLDLLDFDRKRLQDFFVSLGEKSFRADQVIKWVHQQGCTQFEDMTNLSQALRGKLEACMTVHLPEVAYEKASEDGTYKWLFRLKDGSNIETVFIPERERGTLCVSSQVGCTLNCSFCSTGKQGFKRDLTTGEIIGQLWMACRRLSKTSVLKRGTVTNVVMMGMGEPLLNDNVLPALNLMLDDFAYGLSKYRVTLSTSGVVPAMQRLRDSSPVSLAVSLHAPNDALRNVLVPLNKKYPLNKLMSVCKSYFENEPRRRVSFEYVMLKDVNDTKQHANELIALLRDVPCKINLIPFNPFPHTEYQTSSWETITRFQKQLMAAGINTIVRRTRGDDIDAACGQLVGEFDDRTTRREKWLRDASRREGGAHV